MTADPYLGRTIDDRYAIHRLLGRGGMGAVYEARHEGLDRRVAVKFLKGVEMDEGMRDRFLNEARAIAQLSHANVVTIYRVGEVSTVPYLASEYIEGKSLERLSLPIDLPLLLQVALGAAHVLESQLLGLAPTDPVSFAATTSALLTAAIAACLIPARRAASLDPLRALRRE